MFNIAALGSAQTVPEGPRMLANSVQHAGSVVHLRGDVRISMGLVRLAVDEADAHSDTGESSYAAMSVC